MRAVAVLALASIGAFAALGAADVRTFKSAMGEFHLRSRTGEPAAEAKDRASWYSHKTEHFGPVRAAVMIANISGKRWRHGFDFGPWRIDTVRVVDDENTYGLVTGLPPELGDESVWIVTLVRGQDR